MTEGRRLVVSEFMTLDGVMEAPGHEEHRDGRNAWALRGTSEDQQRYKEQELTTTGAILLGRVTYQIFAAFWPTAPASEFKDGMNAVPKHVVSRTLREPTWSNTSIVRDVAREVPELKATPGRDILVHGSADLVDSLMRLRLVDELRIMVFPVVLGSGKRLFRDESDLSHLELVGTRSFSSGVVLLTYRPALEAPWSEYEQEYAWTEEHVRSMQAAKDPDRVLASVLFTDIVDSTGRAAAMGDAEWRRLLDRHDRVARSEVEAFRGRLIKSTGDGILATFDAPTRALRCAIGLLERLREIGLSIRAAIHTGEVELRGEDVGGIAVHIASRALAEAGEGRVVVSRTVRDLATGADLTFAPLGSVGLRGVPGDWDLFEVSGG